MKKVEEQINDDNWTVHDESASNYNAISMNGHFWHDLAYVQKIGYVGICRYLTTVGLCMGVGVEPSHLACQQRFCYNNLADARNAFNIMVSDSKEYNVLGDIIPTDEHWLKGKGYVLGEIRNDKRQTN